jgi:hypothetical protein
MTNETVLKTVPGAVAAAVLTVRPELIRIHADGIRNDYGETAGNLALIVADQIEENEKMRRRNQELEAFMRNTRAQAAGIFNSTEALLAGTDAAREQLEL